MSQPDAEPGPPPERFLAVVHGMGQQPRGSTLRATVERLHDAASRDARGRPRDDVPRLALTVAGALDGQDWFRFEPGRLHGEERCDACAALGGLAVAEVRWSEVTDRFWDTDIGEPVRVWVERLLARSGARDAPLWARRVLQLLLGLVAPLSALMRLRVARLEDLIFGRYLGDVQLYAESQEVRDAARQHFEVRMEELHQKAGEPVDGEADLVLLAHSLGSVLTMDALLEGVLDGADDPDALRRTWQARVRQVVTLGSPLDKFCVLWPERWSYLRSREGEATRAAEALGWDESDGHRAAPVHDNFCDEQDPVGHHLGVFRGEPVPATLLRGRVDQVHGRYALPGLAHVSYWEDPDLFRFLVGELRDPSPTAPREPGDPGGLPAPRSPRVFLTVMVLTYFLVPILVAGVDTVVFAISWLHTSASVRLLGLGAWVLVCLMGRRTLDLLIWWRQVLRGGLLRPAASPSRWRTVLFVGLSLAWIAGWGWASVLALKIGRVGVSPRVIRSGPDLFPSVLLVGMVLLGVALATWALLRRVLPLRAWTPLPAARLETTSFLDRHLPDLVVLGLLVLFAEGVGAEFQGLFESTQDVVQLLGSGLHRMSYPGRIRVVFGFLALHLAVVQTYTMARWLWVKVLVARLAADAQRRTAS